MTWTEHRNKTGDRWLESATHRINRIPVRGDAVPWSEFRYEVWAIDGTANMSGWRYLGRFNDSVSAKQAAHSDLAASASPRIDAAPDPVGKAG